MPTLQPASVLVRALAMRVNAALVAACVVLASCGGDDAPPADVGTPPTITQQPADLTVTAGQPAAFNVVATGDAPLAYRWQRGGADIAGATAATYTLPASALADSGAAFSVVVSDAGGSVTSNAAILTVTASGPVLTVTQQPADASVVAGSMATFSVAATCSSGTLAIQWQRSQGGAAFANIAGATASTYAFSTVVGDSGATFRTALDCGGQSATVSSAATLTVTVPGTVTLTAVPVLGTRQQAYIADAAGIVQEPSGSFVFAYSFGVDRLSADLGTITSVAGSGTFGSADGAAALASFKQPQGLAEDGAGNVYVADTGNHTLRKIASDGTVSTIAGVAGVPGSTDGTGTAARFSSPFAIAIGPDGDLYVADAGNHRVRRVTTAGVVTSYAGSTQGFLDGAAAAAQFDSPRGIAVAANGDVLVSDTLNHRIRRIVRAGNAAGAVETVAGNGTATAPIADGTGTAAVIAQPGGMTIRGNTLTVFTPGLLRQIDLTTTVVTTLTGSRTLGLGYADGTTATARLGSGSVTTADNGGFLITDIASSDNALRAVSASGDVHTIATQAAIDVAVGGTGVLAQMPIGLTSANHTSLPPQAVVVDPAGNVVITESRGADVRRISATGTVTLVAGLTGTNSAGSAVPVDGVGSEAQFKDVGNAIASDGTGVLYVGDAHSVRRIGTDNATTLFAGSRTANGAVDGNAATARLGFTIAGLAVGPTGDVFVADVLNMAIRRVDAGGNVTTYAGALGQAGIADGPIGTARLTKPTGIAFAADGALLIADNGTLRRVTPDGSSMSTIYAGAGPAQGAHLAVDAAGNIYFGGSGGGLFARGLYLLAPGASTATLLVAYDSAGPVLGSAPAARVNDIDAITLAGPKQLVVLTGGQILKVTLP